MRLTFLELADPLGEIVRRQFLFDRRKARGVVRGDHDHRQVVALVGQFHDREAVGFWIMSLRGFTAADPRRGVEV